MATARLADLAAGGVLSARRSAPGVQAARIELPDGQLAAFATDGSLKAGCLLSPASGLIAETIEAAAADGVPVVGLWHSAGASVDGGVLALDGIGRVFAATTAASGRVPQLAVVLGTSAGGAAYGAALADVVITAPAGTLLVTGPGVVRSVTGEEVTAEALGGPQVHSRRSGVTHVAADDEQQALAVARDLVALLRPDDRPANTPCDVDAGLAALLPTNRRRAYDVRPLVARLLDAEHPQVELHARWAPNMVTALGRLGGRSVGVLANNPLRLGGCLDGRGSDKAARFVRLCDGLGVPLVVVVDVPGYLPGVGQEETGVLRRGAKLLHAFAAASVPRVTLHTRKAYGGAYIAMNSRSLGATAVLAWPGAEIAVMGAEAAVEVVHRRELAGVSGATRRDLVAELVAERDEQDGLTQAVAAGLVDRIIDPARTRSEIARALAEAPSGRGRHGNIPL